MKSRRQKRKTEKNKANKKIRFYQLIKTKIIALVVFAVVLTLAINILAFVSRSRGIINNLVCNYMEDVVTATGGNLERDVELLGRSALSTDSLDKKMSSFKLSGIPSSYVYIVDDTGYMLYHPVTDNIGSKVKIESVEAIVDKIKAGETLEPGIMEYVYEGVDKYAAYYISTDSTYLMILTAEKADVMAEVDNLINVVLLLSLIPLLLCACIAAIVAQMISKPIGKTVERINRLSELDLTNEASAKNYSGEVGLINKSVDSLKDKLISTIQSIKTTSEAVDEKADNITRIVEECTETTENINLTVEELAKGATEMACNTESTMHGIENIGNSIEDITSVTNDSLAVVTQATAIGNKSKEALQKLMIANEDTKKSADDVSSGIFEINRTVEAIHKATDMIESIASQTNLLSLNASIEAARAGEAGRGFAVVASEIQGLAEQSSKSAKEIAQVVQQITTLVNNSVKLAQGIKEASENEGNVLGNVSANFDEVNVKLSEVADAVNTIVDRVATVNDEKREILNAISNLSAISEENAASTQETSASLQLLTNHMENVSANSSESKKTADDLKERISEFTI